jgi:hypothetical protein
MPRGKSKCVRAPLGSDGVRERPNGFAVKLPAPKCTSQYVWSMTWCEDPPATHIYRPAQAPASFKRLLGGLPLAAATGEEDAEGAAVEEGGTKPDRDGKEGANVALNWYPQYGGEREHVGGDGYDACS